MLQAMRIFRSKLALPVNLKPLERCIKSRFFTTLPFVVMRPSQRYFRCPNKVPVSPCLQNTPENGTLCASGICHLAAPAHKCPPVPQRKDRPSQQYFRCPNKVPVSPCLQNTPENGTLCASGICHLAAPARKCPPVLQNC